MMHRCLFSEIYISDTFSIQGLFKLQICVAEHKWKMHGRMTPFISSSNLWEMWWDRDNDTVMGVQLGHVRQIKSAQLSLACQPISFKILLQVQLLLSYLLRQINSQKTLYGLGRHRNVSPSSLSRQEVQAGVQNLANLKSISLLLSFYCLESPFRNTVGLLLLWTENCMMIVQTTLFSLSPKVLFTCCYKEFKE